MKSYLQLMLFPDRNGCSKSYFDLKNGMFLNFCIILPIAARADFKLWRARTALWKVKSDCQMEIVNSWEEFKSWKILNFDVSARCMRAQRARGHVRTENFEML